MSFADEDILVALQRARHGNNVASQYRKNGGSLTTRLASYVVSSLSTNVGPVKSMTPLERHAELIYAETLFEKAILGVMYSGDWLSLIKEVYVLLACLQNVTELSKGLICAPLSTYIAPYTSILLQ